MNQKQLLAHFHTISDAPDAIPRLRRFILDLATRGKLVPQIHKDGSSSELLTRITAEKTGLPKGAHRKVLPAQSDSSSKKAPFDIPANWRWARLAEIVDFKAGRIPSRNDLSLWNTGDYPWVSIADMSDGKILTTTKETVSEKARAKIFGSSPESVGRMLMSFKLTIGKMARLGVPAFHNEAIISIKPFIDDIDPYLFVFLPQFARQGDTKGAIKGATLNRESISNILLPLPPLAEQHRIVTRVDELMALCDQLEASQAEREARRDRLMFSSFARLNTPDPERFRDDARFTLDALPELTKRPDQVTQLRQTILNLAVLGKLVPQNPIDQTAAEFLKHVAARSPQTGSGRARSNETHSQKRDWQVESVPASWQTVLLGSVCSLVTSGSRGWAEFYSKSGPRFIRAQNIRFGKLKLDDLACVNPPANSEGSRTAVTQGDLLIVITGAGVTNPALLNVDLGEAYVSQHVGLVRPADTRLSEWLLLCLMAPAAARAELAARAYGAGRPGLNLDNIRNLRIPVPPLAEQRSILARLKELMGICDQLEESNPPA